MATPDEEEQPPFDPGSGIPSLDPGPAAGGTLDLSPQSWAGRRLMGALIPGLGGAAGAVGDITAANAKASAPGAGATLPTGSAGATLLAGTPSDNYQPLTTSQQLDLAAANQPPPSPLSPGALKKPGGGGGGGGGLPLGPTAGQTLARGAELNADEGEAAVLRQKGEVEKQKALDQVELDKQQAAREEALQKAQQQRHAELDSDIKAKQDVLSKDRIHDMFEGRPLAAILAAISSGLGAFAASRTGGQNQAQAILDNAAQMFRQKELHRIEQEEKGVSGAIANRDHIEARADAATAQLYRNFAREREAVLRRRGFDDAQVAQDRELQDLVRKGADRDVQWQDKTAQIARDEVNDRARRAAEYGSANASNANAAKARAEAEAGGLGQKGDRAAGHKIDLGIFGAGVVNAVNEAAGLGLSHAEVTDALQKVQRNETSLKSQEGPKSAVGAFLSNKARDIGALPQSRTEGLSPKQTQFINKMDIAQKKAATVLAGQGRANSHEMVEALRPQPGDDPESIRQKMVELAALGQSAKDEAQQYGDIAAGAIARTKAAGLPGPAPAKLPPLTPAQRVQTQAWYDANKNNPREADRVARARARLME